MALTEKQKRFCEEYAKNPNATKAYIAAGYKVSESVAKANASRLLTNANVAAYISELADKVRNEAIADLDEVKRFWTTTLRDSEADSKDRIKVSELIAKSEGGFLERVEHSGSIEIKTFSELYGDTKPKSN